MLSTDRRLLLVAFSLVAPRVLLRSPPLHLQAQGLSAGVLVFLFLSTSRYRCGLWSAILEMSRLEYHSREVQIPTSSFLRGLLFREILAIVIISNRFGPFLEAVDALR